MKTKLASLFLLFILVPSVFAEVNGTETAVVTHIVDGDTIDVNLNGEIKRVRYIGIDTPETDEAYFTEATEANRALVEGQTVTMVKDVSETDFYGRLLRYVYLQDNTFVNAQLVEDGWARATPYDPDTVYEATFAQLEAEAQAAKRGIWQHYSEVFLPMIVNGAGNYFTPPTSPIVITTIFYDGVVPNVESDEYIEIKNVSDTAVDLSNWRINAGDDGQDFYPFDNYQIQPNESCRIFTNQLDNETCSFSFEFGRSVWNNAGDCGYLYDAADNLVDEYCY